jgi:ubiquinone/menaquinone biosynthesis C-methylase UbiE
MKADDALRRRDDSFLAAAGSYDRDFSAIPLVRSLRGRVVRIGMKEFRPGGTLLEIGCGTGDDALLLARAGFSVTATDASPEMLRLATVKTVSDRNRIRLLPLDAADLSSLGEQTFDGIFSNFGPLNCIEDLSRFFSQAHRTLAPGGTLVLCLIGRWSPWEIGGFLIRGEGRKALRRLAPPPVRVSVAGMTVPTWYHPASSVIGAARPCFMLVRSEGLNVISPPPSSTRFAEAYPLLTRALRGFEGVLGGIRPMSRLGDHVVFVFRKRL